ncbi:TPA: hypothetical protein VEP96_004780 [Pseudomonas aeruginosa]|nr:hypothetical protein [Pseudomonas aeruginosa]
MKSTITTLSILALALLSTSSFADFSVKIPLEINNGGSLPNNSIIFNNSDEPEPIEQTEPEPGNYEVSMTISIQNSGNNTLYNGVSQPGFSNAESSYLDLSSNTFYLSKDYENYFWRDGEYTEFAPNVGGYIDFNGTGGFCQISNVSETSSGTTYSCSNRINISPNNSLINTLLLKRTN